MFGSQILEVGIGLILVFLLVSLILTAVREAIESFTKTRSRDLELAIAELLHDREGTGLRKELYEHPLVFSLFPGGAHPTRFTATGKVEHRACKNVPSYIPREVFSAALQDILKAKAAADAKTGDVARGADRPHIVKAYEALVAAAGDDAERARKGLEQWYDASMDRASGWFKRRTQMILLVLGVVVAVALNINAITIGQYLATHKEAAEQLADTAAQVHADYVAAGKAEPEQPAAATPDAGNVAAVEAEDEDGNATSAAANEAAVADASGNTIAAPVGESEEAANQANANSASSAGTTEDEERSESAELARRIDAQVRAVGLPIGWDKVQYDRTMRELKASPVWTLISLIIGYLMVGFAATLGAPFWFDLLGKFMVVRSTVKPTEKSPDEASKDGGTGGSPKPRPREEEEEPEAVAEAGGSAKSG